MERSEKDFGQITLAYVSCRQSPFTHCKVQRDHDDGRLQRHSSKDSTSDSIFLNLLRLKSVSSFAGQINHVHIPIHNAQKSNRQRHDAMEL